LSEADITQINELSAKWLDEVAPNQPMFLLIDNRETKIVTSGARKAIVSVGEVTREIYCASFGAPFALRAVLNLVFKALAIYSRKVVTRFAADEAEAREWLAERRRAGSPRTR
jgi:hypothetical protein